MKKILTLFASMLIFSQLFAQAPKKMSYQAIVRNDRNQLIVNNAVGMRVSILEGSASGRAVYVETHRPVANGNGTVTIEIGMGRVVSGVFGNINWSKGNYWLRTEIDPMGAASYRVTGTVELLTVPYAFYADYASNSGNAIQKVTDNGDGTLTFTYQNGTTYKTGKLSGLAGANGKDGVSIVNTKIENDSLYISLNNGQVLNAGSVVAASQKKKHYIGEYFGGGVIFHLWEDSLGVEHGLIVDTKDLAFYKRGFPNIDARAAWSNVMEEIGAGAQSTWDGYNNSLAIVSQPGHVSSAASLCINSNSNGQTGWYLPAFDELFLLWQKRFEVNKALSKIEGATIAPVFDLLDSPIYWTSTEYYSSAAIPIDFGTGSISSIINKCTSEYCFGKANNHSVRAIRAF